MLPIFSEINDRQYKFRGQFSTYCTALSAELDLNHSWLSYTFFIFSMIRHSLFPSYFTDPFLSILRCILLSSTFNVQCPKAQSSDLFSVLTSKRILLPKALNNNPLAETSKITTVALSSLLNNVFQEMGVIPSVMNTYGD